MELSTGRDCIMTSYFQKMLPQSKQIFNIQIKNLINVCNLNRQGGNTDFGKQVRLFGKITTGVYFISVLYKVSSFSLVPAAAGACVGCLKSFGVLRSKHYS
jgi:hypothetical protein